MPTFIPTRDLLFQRIRYTEPIRYRVFYSGRLVGVVWREKNGWVVEGSNVLWKTRLAAGEFLMSWFDGVEDA